MTVQPAFECADSASFCLFNTSVFFVCIFSTSADARLFFVFEICGRVGNEMPDTRKILVTRRWVQLDKKRWGRTSLHFSLCRSSRVKTWKPHKGKV